jgi:16S rRNA (guanine527-N7)-methyltransferase
MDVGSSEWKNLIISGAEILGVRVSDNQAEQFGIHAAELLRWNKKINLTAITDPEEVAVKHFTDCLVPAKIIPTDSRLLDIGSGGGFPGIVLKILMPSLHVTLIDSSRRKNSFQKQVIRILGLKNIEAHHIRAEEFAKIPDAANSFDIVICRAFSAAKAFFSTAMPFLAKGGAMIAMKGKISEDEIRSEFSEAVYENMSIEKYSLPFCGADRAILKSGMFTADIKNI